MTDERYDRGLERLRELAGETGVRVMDGLREVAPELERYVVSFGYGEVYREGPLDDRTRQLTAIAALAAMGGADPQVEYHVEIALARGVEAAEIVATLTHLAPFVGFARTLNAMRAVRRALHARGEER